MGTAATRSAGVYRPFMEPQDAASIRLVPADDPTVLQLTEAVQTGDIARLEVLLVVNPWLATARFGDSDCYRTALHIATDWPGHYVNGVAVVNLLIDAGADVNAHSCFDSHTETPLHWAASSNDVAVLDALLDAGADIDAPGAVLGGGTALADACGFRTWPSARRLVERGATVRLQDAAALGMLDRVKAACEASPGTPDSVEITRALWSACQGDQQPTAEYLIGQGADINWVGWDNMTPLDIAERDASPSLVHWLSASGAIAHQTP